MNLQVTLSFHKATQGSVHYQLRDRAGQPITDLYIRKHALIPAPDGTWPQEITVTVEVPS
jgi:hypothetical protein